MIGKCLEKIFQIESHEKIKHLTLVGETIDQHGRERFHPLTFRLHFNGPLNKTNREWIYYRPFHPTLFVSFPLIMIFLSYFIFDPLGLRSNK